MSAAPLALTRRNFMISGAEMSRYRLAWYLRPVAILFVPGTFFLVFVLKSDFIVVVIWILAHSIIGWLIRCPKCGKTTSYFDKERPVRTLLARPHRVCANCGARFD